MSDLMRSRLMIASSMVIFGTISLFVRNIAVSSAELALYRAILAALMIAGFLCLRGKRIHWTQIRPVLPVFLATGAALGANWILLFEAYRYTTVSAATLSYYFAPVLVTLISSLLFREKLSPKGIICFVMSTAGIVMITGVCTLSGKGDAIGILLGLCAAVLYAAVVLMNKKIQHVDGIERTLLQFSAAAMVLLPYVVLTQELSLVSLGATDWILLLVVGCVHTGVAYCLYFTGLRHIPGQEAAILSYADPLVAVLLSITVLGEAMNPWQIAGGILILGFTLWNEWKS